MMTANLLPGVTSRGLKSVVLSLPRTIALLFRKSLVTALTQHILEEYSSKPTVM